MKKNIFFTCFDQVENIWDAHIENQTSFYKNHHSKLDVRERFLHATVANLPPLLVLWWGPPWDPRVDDSYPGAAGARELAHRAPGAIILGGGCEFVLEFLETYLEA